MASRRSFDPQKSALPYYNDGKDTWKKKRRAGEWVQSAKHLSRQLINNPRGVVKSALNRNRLKNILPRAFAVYSVYFIIRKLFFRGPYEDILQHIDPLIGTALGGHVFAGATLPFGMAKPVADLSGSHNMAGFAWDESPVTGFSSLHDSGSGALASLGNFPIFLHPSCPNIKACPMTSGLRKKPFIPAHVRASPGHFGITLNTGVHAEMTATEHVSLFVFSFIRGTETYAPVLLVDGSDLPNTSGPRSLKIDTENNRITAKGSFSPSFGQGSYFSYQCIDFRGGDLKDFGVFNDTAFPGLTSTDEEINQYWAPRQGVYVRFKPMYDNNKIQVRVGLSWLSTEKACQNAEREIGDFDFDRVKQRARDMWSEKFSPISIDSKGVKKENLRNFWSGAYRAFLSPQDYSEENQLWNSTEPYYDSWYCIWDTFRGVHPFYTLIDTVSQSRMVRSLIDIFKHEGWMPDCRMSFCKGYTQGGSSADVVIVDSYLKNVTGVDWKQAYAALIKDAEVQPLNWNLEGRGALSSWKEKGYIPYRDSDQGGLPTRSISRTVEYAYNDFCIAEMANSTGRATDFAKYIERAGNWKNVFDLDHESMGFTGFPQPRWENGTFAVQDATLCSPINDPNGCFLNRDGKETYEGSPWLYQFYVPGDMQGLIDLLGGPTAFIKRLDTLHDSGVLDMGNEQAFLTAFLYHYAGRPGLSAKRTHQYIPSMFNDTKRGIPGNDDGGAMGTLALFSMLGVFPNAGQNVYFIVPPFFRSVSITSPQTGNTATIRNVNFDPKYQRIYIQSAKLDGKPYTKNWIDHSFFLQGGTLELILGEDESDWGADQDSVPPSLSTGLHLS